MLWARFHVFNVGMLLNPWFDLFFPDPSLKVLHFEGLKHGTHLCPKFWKFKIEFQVHFDSIGFACLFFCLLVLFPSYFTWFWLLVCLPPFLFVLFTSFAHFILAFCLFFIFFVLLILFCLLIMSLICFTNLVLFRLAFTLLVIHLFCWLIIQVLVRSWSIVFIRLIHVSKCM